MTEATTNHHYVLIQQVDEAVQSLPKHEVRAYEEVLIIVPNLVRREVAVVEFLRTEDWDQKRGCYTHESLENDGYFP